MIKNARESIKSAFTELYLQKAIDRITVDAICKRAYISRSSFYKNYSGINAVVNEIEGEVEKEMQRIYVDYNYQNFMDIDPRYPSPSFVEMFRCVLRFRDFFDAAYSDHGNPSFYHRSKRLIRENLKKSISTRIESEEHQEIICDICSDYIIICCKMIIKYEDRLSPKGMAIEVKKHIIDFVNNEKLYIEGETIPLT